MKITDIAKDVYINGAKELNKDDIFDIIKSLRPGCTFNATFNDGSVQYEKFWHPNNLPAPTIEEIMDEFHHQKKCKEYYQYAYNRCQEYPDGFEQFDMLWHAINNEENLKNSEWFQTIKSIKEKYPKPNIDPPIKSNK
jgi:hypothetical protein